jgi:two-component system LytT family response regulator
VEVVATCADGEEALTAVRALAPDAVFLDVRMPGRDGLAVARALVADSAAAAPAIVFATAYGDHALTAFEVSAVDYLLKPFGAERVRETVRRLRERLARHDGATLRAQLAAVLERLGPARADEAGGPWAERLVVGIARGARVVNVRDVEWLEAADNYVTVHSVDGSGLLREPLKSLEARLSPAMFARVHRSAVVNLGRVRELRPQPSGDYELTLRSGATVTLSRTYRDEVLRRLR